MTVDDRDLEAIEWQSISDDGTKYALLRGRRDRPGEAFTYAFEMPAGFWDPPHWHTSDALVTVVEGTLFLGYGERLNAADASVFPAGSKVLVPAAARHFDGTEDGALIVGEATGVWTTYYVDARSRGSAGTTL